MDSLTKYWIWLQKAIGMASDRSDALLAAFETPKDIYEHRADIEHEVSVLQPRDCVGLKGVPLTAADKVISDCERFGFGILTPDMPMFPKCLLGICGVPMVLYTVGDQSLLNLPVKATMVGTRQATKYATRAAYKLSYDLAKAGVVIVSGYALGIDSWSHGGALDAGGKTIAVAGAGLDVNYPSQNADLRNRIMREGLVISEFPPFSRPERAHFPYRNRVLAALSKGTILVEAPRISGALITARSAVEQGKDLYVVPHDIFNSNAVGGMDLLKECGYVITNAVDFLRNYLTEYAEQLNLEAIPTKNEYTPSEDVLSQDPKNGVKKTISKPVDLPEGMDENTKAVYNILKAGKFTADELAERSELPIGTVLGVLTELELEDWIHRTGSNTYTALPEN